ncbi:adenylate/guanylate cyclase domain-containing protein [Mycobacterium parmense]|uniref:adenylate/guanylate cyclase domain-containing protein n=1 Tax=Mycobacterium parmense TaxID=185642 RepID=UPI0015D152A5|nr:adenylate/guanylate cyclase domain-containing protein [Mycobacterium parmense]MCV7352337.1 adenylate/guanylate cyclase domain-containing protein [Mycobacterium parmense]
MTSAHILAAGAVSLVIVSLTRNTSGNPGALFTRRNLIALCGLVAISATVGAVAGVLNMVPSFRWFADGAEPTDAQQRAAMRIAPRQTVVQFGIWVTSGAVFVLVNIRAGGDTAWVIGTAIVFGGAVTASMGYLITHRILRPIIAASMKTATPTSEMPGVLARLMITWVLFSALPTAGIALIVLAHSNGWFVQKSAPIEMPILVLAAVSLAAGLRAMVLVARSISDPVREVIVAMTEVEHGRGGAFVEVYEPSEIGRLQVGFNRMVAGLEEREQLRDLFGRHVGADVAHRALLQDGCMSGEVRDVAILFVDLVGSTAIAASRRPEEVAAILNDFFRIVVAAVHQRCGLINKFEGDAVLAVFGAPIDIDDPTSAALATARTLGTELRKLPLVDFGIGVAAGAVFAGNIGAEDRYEYTVVGDAVNEAARLADHAKGWESRTLASGSALARAQVVEQQHWATRGAASLRGRSAVTELAEPLLDD